MSSTDYKAKCERMKKRHAEWRDATEQIMSDYATALTKANDAMLEAVRKANARYNQ